MCVGIPGQVVAIKGKKAKVKQEDHFHWLDTSLIKGGVKKGDWLLNYQDAAINKVSAKAAKETEATKEDNIDYIDPICNGCQVCTIFFSVCLTLNDRVCWCDLKGSDRSTVQT